MRELKKISKKLSYILRHNPGAFGLILDKEGWVPMEEIERKAGIRKKDIYRVVRHQRKRRFEIRGGKIRALYGHSVMKLSYPEVEPPLILYHGTSPERALRILKEGLKPIGRHYVHLSMSRDEAKLVGLRHSKRPVILMVRAREAYRKGIKFYKAGDLFLSDPIPPKFLEMLKDFYPHL